MLIGVLAVSATAATAATVAAAIAVTTALGVAGAAIGASDAFLSAFFSLHDIRHRTADDQKNGDDGDNFTDIHYNLLSVR